MKVRKLTVCHTCRTRKLGCDGKRPSCSQCVWAKIKCGGYQYDLIFVPSNLNKPNKTGRDGVSKKQRGDQCQIAPPTSVMVHATKEALYQSQPPIAPSLSWPLQDVISLVVQNFTPRYDGFILSWNQNISPGICGAWIELLPDLSATGRHGKALSASVKALGISILGKGQDGIAPISDALDAHCSALRSIYDCLQDVRPADTNVLAAAIMCLLMSELILPTCDTSSVAHACGLGELMQLHSPDFYSSGPSHRLFIGLRPALVIHAICTRTPTFLAKTEWKTLPFEYNLPSSLQTLMSEATAFPEILLNIAALDVNPDPAAPHAALLELQELMNGLDDWNTSFHILAQKPPFRVSGKDPEHSRIWFPNITAANSMTHYWAFWTMCLVYMRRLMIQYPSLVDTQVLVKGQSPDNPVLTEVATQMSKWILQSVDFLLQDEMKLFGAMSLTLPARIAYQFLQANCSHDPQIVSWCERIVQKVKQKGYPYIVHFIMDSNGP